MDYFSCDLQEEERNEVALFLLLFFGGWGRGLEPYKCLVNVKEWVGIQKGLRKDGWEETERVGNRKTGKSI